MFLCAKGFTILCFADVYMMIIIQIKHSSEGISKNYPHKVPLEQSNTPEAIAEGAWTVLKVQSVGNFTIKCQNRKMIIICCIRLCFFVL